MTKWLFLLLLLASCASKPTLSYASRAPASVSKKTLCEIALERSGWDADGSTQKKAREPIDKEFEIYRVANWYKKIDVMRDSMSEWLRIKMSHPYPIAVADDFPVAFAYAQKATGKINDDSELARSLGDVGQLHKDLMDSTQKVLTFQTRKNNLIDRAVSLALQERILNEFVEKDLRSNSRIRVPWPIWGANSKGKYEIIWREEYFGSKEQLAINLNQIKKDRKQILDEAEDLNFDQVATIERLRVYRHELFRAASQNPGFKFPEPVQAFLNESERIFSDTEGMAVKDEFKAGTDAYQRMRWKQWRAELGLALPFIKKNVDEEHMQRLKSLTRVIDQLDAREFERLGLNHLAVDVKAINNSKAVKILYLVVGYGGGGLGTVRLAYNIILKDQIDKNNCIREQDGNAYLNCVQQYIEERFPGSFFKSYKETQQALTDTGKVKNPKIRAILDEFKQRRHEFEYNRNKQEIVLNNFKNELELLTMGSETYITHMVRGAPDDASFRMTLLSDDPSVGYLQYKYSVLLANPNIKSIVTRIVNAISSEDEELHILKLKELPNGELIANDLQRILNLRRSFINDQRRMKQLDSKILEQAAAMFELKEGSELANPSIAIPVN